MKCRDCGEELVRKRERESGLAFKVAIWECDTCGGREVSTVLMLS